MLMNRSHTTRYSRQEIYDLSERRVRLMLTMML